MAEYVLEGGPHDGRRVTTDGTRVLRMPVMRPMNVLDMRRGPQVAMDVVEYELFGRVYRYTELIGDAWAEMAVSEEVFVEPRVRLMVRQQMRRHLEGLDTDKQVDRIVWRVCRSDRTFTWVVRAFVGPRRIERALSARAAMRGAADRLDEVVG